MPTIESMMKKERADVEAAKQMYVNFSQELNDLINLYFSIENEGKLFLKSNYLCTEDMEIQVAGGEEERNAMMPLLYIDNAREKSELVSEINSVLREYHYGQKAEALMDSENRLKALDVTKVLMGIMSSRENIKRFAYDERFWARR